MFKSMVSMELATKNSGVKRKLIKHSMARKKQRKSHKLRLTCMISLLLDKSNSKSLM